MSWKYYKKLFENVGIDENKFILGVDIGLRTSAIACYNTITEEPELIDLSGGYGKPSMPSVIQFIPETREWVFGEYALLNKGLFEDYTIMDMMKKLGKNEYVEIGSKAVSAVWLLSKYIKELIEFCKNVNPLSEIAGIVCVIPTYFSDEEKEELKTAFIGAGLEKQLIGFITARESALIHNYYNSGFDAKVVMTIDFGAQKIRGSIDRLEEDLKGIYVVTESYYEEESAGFDEIDKEISELFTNIYCEEKCMEIEKLSEQEIDQLFIFTQHNKAQMFKANASNRPSKLYYNFAYPPFVKQLENDFKNEFIGRLEAKITEFISLVLKKSKSRLAPADIDKVICVGGGFESPSIKTVVEKCFPKAALQKHGKAVLAEGAAIYAAKMLGVYNCEDFFIKDSALLPSDYGVIVRQGDTDRFIPIIERNAFWWLKREGAVFTLAKSSGAEIILKIYERGKSGEETELADIELDGLEKRPPGTTRLKITINFPEFAKMHVKIEDFGFGELFPKTDYTKELLLDLCSA